MSRHFDPLRPPAQADPYVRVLGLEGAVEFLLRFGGTEIYLARTPQGRGQVEALVGKDRAAALAQADLPRRVPLCKPWIAQIAKAHGLPPDWKPLTTAEIARRMHASDVTVRKWLGAAAGRATPDPRQPTLFED